MKILSPEGYHYLAQNGVYFKEIVVPDNYQMGELVLISDTAIETMQAMMEVDNARLHEQA